MLFQQRLGNGEVEVFSGSIDFAREIRRRGLKTAVVTASANGPAVLAAAKIADLFDRVVDGKVAEERALLGKPAPDSFLEAARELNVEPWRAVVVEDAESGVQAGQAGRFGLVIGVDRHGRPERLRACGADVVVSDLADLLAG
jgi:HAD superfamily hydrolase (TIGR01509 family)